MRPIIALPLLAGLALAACGSEKSADTPLSMEDVKQEAAKVHGPKPGQYRSSVKVLEFDIPGLPPQAADQMKQMMSGQKSQAHEYCLTEADTKGGYEEMVKKGQQGNCTFDRFDATASTIDAAMTCKLEQGMVSNVTMKGTTRDDGMAMDMDMVQNDANIPGGKMRMKLQMTSQRIGDCPPAK
jgi:hypothetical protein